MKTVLRAGMKREKRSGRDAGFQMIAEAQWRGQLAGIGQQTAILEFRFLDQLTQQLLHLRVERYRAVVIQGQHLSKCMEK